jgi:hypothetical protein
MSRLSSTGLPLGRFYDPPFKGMGARTNRTISTWA